MDISKLSECGTVRNYTENDFICIEGNPGDTAFLVLKGSVNVLIGSFYEKKKNVATITVGAFFGEMSMLEKAPRSATVMAAEKEVVLLEIHENDFLKLIKTEPDLGFNLLKTLHSRIENTMNEGARHLVAYNAEIRRNKHYIEMGNITLEQFKSVVLQNEEYAIKLLGYLSHTLTALNRELVCRVNA